MYYSIMINFAFMLKTYAPDFNRVVNLIKSFNKYNVANCKLFIVVSAEDLDLFSTFISNNVTVVCQDSIPVRLANSNSPLALSIKPGYINQEIIKLSFWKMSLCKNYLCLDSDGEFIRDFAEEDFMHDNDSPFTVATDDKDLKSDSEYYDKFWNIREVSIRKIFDSFNLPQPKYLQTCHGFQILSSKYLKSMMTDFMEPNNLDYIDLLMICPYEFSWYTIYLQKINEKIYYVEPFFKYFHTSSSYINSRLLGIGREELARSYAGIVVNGNFQAKNRIIDSNSSISKVFGFYVPLPVILKSIIYKVPFVINIVKHRIKKAVRFSVG